MPLPHEHVVNHAITSFASKEQPSQRCDGHAIIAAKDPQLQTSSFPPYVMLSASQLK